MGLANWKVIVLCSSHLRWLGKCVHMWHWREKKPDCYPQKAHCITTNIIPGEIQSSWRRGTNKEMWLRLSVQRRHLASHRSLRDISIYRVSKCQYGAILMQMGLQTCHVVRASREIIWRGFWQHYFKSHGGVVCRSALTGFGIGFTHKSVCDEKCCWSSACTSQVCIVKLFTVQKKQCTSLENSTMCLVEMKAQ